MSFNLTPLSLTTWVAGAPRLCEPLKKNPGKGKWRNVINNNKPCFFPLHMQEAIQRCSWCYDGCILMFKRSSGMKTG